LKVQKVKKERSLTGQKPVVDVTYFFISGLRAKRMKPLGEVETKKEARC
jgi:hypothetical protein